MAVAVEMSFKGATLAQYEQVIKKMGFSHGGKGPPDALFHWVAATSGGFRVVDVWKTKEQYERFAKEQIGPYAAEAGIPGPPEVTYTETPRVGRTSRGHGSRPARLSP